MSEAKTQPSSRYPTVSVLVLDRDAAEVERVRRLLAVSPRTAFRVHHCTRLEDALRTLVEEEIDVILIDPSLPEMPGMDAISRLRNEAPDVPLVITAADEDETLGLEAVHRGAHGYLIKGEGGAQLLTRTLLHTIERQRMTTELHSARERERHLATHDQLTGLANRLLFRDRLAQALGSAHRTGEKLAVLFLDLDRFKNINESLGHAIGDQFLRAVARRLTGCLRKSDTIARLGGDEFAILLRSLSSELDSARLAQKILRALSEPIVLRGRRYFTSASIGISVYPNDGWEGGDLVKCADTAMYHAKAQGRSRFEFFTTDMNTQALERLTLENQLRVALEREEMRLHYQPQIDVEREEIIGAEALLRWIHPEKGLIPPGDFLPLAEETGLVIPLGEWVLRTACRQNRIWRDAGHPGFRLSVNASPLQFRELGFASVVEAALEEAGLPPDALELEITESGLMEEVETTMTTLRDLRDLGVRLSIDDFGTGYSALAYLKRLPVDSLKIDRSFVNGVTQDPADATIASTVIAIAQGLGLETVAEGVETREQMEFFASHGCPRMQGFLFARPLEPEAFERRLQAPALPWEKDSDETPSETNGTTARG